MPFVFVVANDVISKIRLLDVEEKRVFVEKLCMKATVIT
jgi:hypothetical protein